MPVVACPKCPTQLKIPDGSKGNVRCPKCTTIFLVGVQNSVTAFEAADAPPKSAPGSKVAAPPPKLAPKPAPVKADDEDEADFEVVDEKPKKRKRADEDHDEEDDEDDRPKSKKKRRSRADDDDYEDDEDDRPRKKKRRNRRPDDDDDYDWAPRPKSNKRGAFGKGKTGALLLSISCWLNLGSFALIALYVLIAWLMVLAASNSSPSAGGGRRGGGGGGDAATILDIIAVLPGLAGLGAWIVGLIGCAFSIAGPARARGMAITATVFAGVHLVLMGITFDNLRGGMGLARGVPGVGQVAWIAVVSVLPATDMFLPMLLNKELRPGLESGAYLLGLLAGVCELLRLVFIVQTLKATADAAGNGYAVEKAEFSAMITYFIAGGVPIITLLLLFLAQQFKGSGSFHLAFFAFLIMYCAYAFMMFGPAMAALQTKNACARRS